MDAESSISVVLSTCPEEQAERLASSLVEERRAACVNIVPKVASVYRWEGKIERAGESLLVIKCATSGVPSLIEALVRLHPYEVPEVIELPVARGHEAYLRWVLAERRSG
jgi:periplasmic divalent cation tolerance protein